MSRNQAHSPHLAAGRRRVSIDQEGRADLLYSRELELSSTRAWEAFGDIARTACLDLFHQRFELASAPPHSGTPVRIRHALGPVGFWRHGRLLVWEPGRRWAFSDLSSRRPTAGFPHIYDLELIPLETGRCRLELRIRGRWTARRLPLAIVRWWLALVLAKVGLALDIMVLETYLEGTEAEPVAGPAVERLHP